APGAPHQLGRPSLPDRRQAAEHPERRRGQGRHPSGAHQEPGRGRRDRAENELQTITRARVDLSERRVTVLAKRKARQAYRERPVYLSTAAVALLAERLKPDIAPDTPLFDLKNLRKIWEWVRINIGRPEVRWHDLRHTHGTMLGKTTKNTRIISAQLGHTNPATSNPT